MAENKFEVGHCPSCGSERADVVAEHKEDYSDPIAARQHTQSGP